MHRYWRSFRSAILHFQKLLRPVKLFMFFFNLSISFYICFDCIEYFLLHFGCKHWIISQTCICLRTKEYVRVLLVAWRQGILSQFYTSLRTRECIPLPILIVWTRELCPDSKFVRTREYVPVLILIVRTREFVPVIILFVSKGICPGSNFDCENKGICPGYNFVCKQGNMSRFQFVYEHGFMSQFILGWMTDAIG